MIGFKEHVLVLGIALLRLFLPWSKANGHWSWFAIIQAVNISKTRWNQQPSNSSRSHALYTLVDSSDRSSISYSENERDPVVCNLTAIHKVSI